MAENAAGANAKANAGTAGWERLVDRLMTLVEMQGRQNQLLVDALVGRYSPPVAVHRGILPPVQTLSGAADRSGIDPVDDRRAEAEMESLGGGQ